MDLTKRLGFSADILKTATEVLEGKKIVHPNQKAISAAAPPHDEITAADFKALKAKKKHRVEGFDRNKKRYESPLFETYEEALAFYSKIRKSAPLTNLEIVQIDELSRPVIATEDVKIKGRYGGVNLTHSTHGTFKANYDPDESTTDTPEAAVDIEVHHPNGKKTHLTVDHNGLKHQGGEKLPGDITAALEKHASKYREKNLVGPESMKESTAVAATGKVYEEAKELNTANANAAREHDCAKHVVHEQWGVGETVPTMHAEPDAAGSIAWYDVMFEHGIEHQVATSDLEITLSETHGHGERNKRNKGMSEAEEHGKKKVSKKDVPQVEMHPKVVAEKTLTPAELKKREEVAKAIKRKQPGMPMGMKMAIATKVAKDVTEEVDTLDEGRNAGPRRDPLTNKAHPLYDEAVKKFKELTGGKGNPSSYFHRENKFKDHADAAIEHAKKVHSASKSSEGEDESVGDQDQHPAMQVKKAADLAPTSANPKGGAKVQGKHMSHADAKQVLGDYMQMKPSEKENAAKNMHALIKN